MTPIPTSAIAPVHADTGVSVSDGEPEPVSSLEETRGEGFMALDSDRIVTDINSEALRLYRKRFQEIVGQRYDATLSAAIGVNIEDAFHRVSVDRQVIHYEQFSEQENEWLEVSIYPADAGGVHIFFRDISARKKAEADLYRSVAVFRETQKRLELAFEAVHLGMWEWNVRTGEQHWSEEQERLFGVERGGFQGGITSFLDIVHPEDREQAVASAQRCLTVPDGSEYEDEFRIQLPSGTIRWIHGRARVERDPTTGEPLRVTGVNLDVTERKRAEERENFVSRLSEQLRAIADPGEVAREAAGAVGEFLHATRCLFVTVEEAGTVPTYREWIREDAERAGNISRALREESLFALLITRDPLIVDDVLTDRRLSANQQAFFTGIGTRSLIRIPIYRGEVPIACFGVNDSTVRDWQPEEVQLIQQVAERTWTTYERTYLFRKAQEDEARFRALVEASSQMVWRTDADGQIVDMPEWRGYTGQAAEAVRGSGWLDAIHDEDRPRVRRVWREAFDARGIYECEYRVLGKDGVYRWFAARGVPLFDTDGVLREYIGTWISIDEQRQVEEAKANTLRRERERAEQLRQLADASLLINSAESLSEMLQVICDKAREVIGAHQAMTSIPKGEDWSQTINAVSLSDMYEAGRDYTDSPEGYGIDALVYGENRVIRLTRTELENHPLWRGFGRHTVALSSVNGWLAAPLMTRDGKNLGRIQLGDRYEGDFTESDEAILVQLARLAANAMENQRLYEDARRRAEREALINQIGDGIRQALPPDEIESRAVRALGLTLGADRCYLIAVDLSRDVLSIARDWCYDGVPSIAGQYHVSDLGEDFATWFASGETRVVFDARPRSDPPLPDDNAPTNELIGAASFLHVPFYGNDRIVGILAVAMAHESREWTEDDVSLAETVAGQLRTALEAVRQQQRERNIAQQLQEALQPAIPDTIPGMLLASHYRAALEEAEVGGDFYDTFRLSDHRFALVVADLSGKGLGAARQVALTRHQLRYAIYTADLDGAAGLATAVQRLNRILADYEQLTGFATLFVAVWDNAASTLTYVNAGQEPGLIWRAASGEVETLVPTGTVLGGFAEATFTQSVIPLFPGDIWTAFTDGMTEIGPTRKELLGIEGVVPIFAQCCSGYTAESPTHLPDPRMILSGLIASVKGFGRGTGIRDDLCALVGIRQHP